MWLSLKVSQFKTETISWSLAVEKFYERAILIQAQLDPIYNHDTHLIEELQTGIRDQPFYMFVERSESASSTHQYFQICLSAIAKQEDMKGIVARHRADGTYMSQVPGILVQDRYPRVTASHFYPPKPHQLSSNLAAMPRWPFKTYSPTKQQWHSKARKIQFPKLCFLRPHVDMEEEDFLEGQEIRIRWVEMGRECCAEIATQMSISLRKVMTETNQNS